MDYCGGLEPLPGGNGLGVILVVVSVEGSSATGETVVVASVVGASVVCTVVVVSAVVVSAIVVSTVTSSVEAVLTLDTASDSDVAVSVVTSTNTLSLI